MATVPAPAADRVVEATAAAARVAELVGAETSDAQVLHQSNNVVIRFADVVLKVSTDFRMAERGVFVASHVSAAGGPALSPLLAPIVDGDFSISAWPYLPEGLEITAREAGKALRDLHRTLVGVSIDLPPLSSRFDKVAAVIADCQATSALDPRDRAVLQSAVDIVAPATTGADALHTEPDDRNRLRRDGQVMYIDFEAASVGPSSGTSPISQTTSSKTSGPTTTGCSGRRSRSEYPHVCPSPAGDTSPPVPTMPTCDGMPNTTSTPYEQRWPDRPQIGRGSARLPQTPCGGRPSTRLLGTGTRERAGQLR